MYKNIYNHIKYYWLNIYMARERWTKKKLKKLNFKYDFVTHQDFIPCNKIFMSQRKFYFFTLF